VAQTWTPEALEELLAPIALYPDPVLSQMLIASTNPQEVLDAGNWLLQNTELKGKALDDAAATVGFTPPIRALVQFPETVDMMCLELGGPPSSARRSSPTRPACSTPCSDCASRRWTSATCSPPNR